MRPPGPSTRRRRRAGRVRQVGGVLVTMALLGGCGSVTSLSSLNGNGLTIYSSLPLQGPASGAAQALVEGEKLALAQAGGQVGPYKISFYSMDDSSPARGLWDPGITAANAKVAAQDRTTIAYIGDYDSGATAVSLPLINAGGILQVSPGSPYVGLTSPQAAGQDEPGRFYPSNVRTFGRLVPGDLVEAQVQARFMRSLGAHSLYLVNSRSPFEFGAALAQLVARDARRLGISVVGQDSLDVRGTTFPGLVQKVTTSGADAVFYSGGPGPGPVALWQELHAADAHLALLGSDAVATPAFTSLLGPAASATHLTTPILAPDRYPSSAQSFFREFHRRFGFDPTPVALYGYEAMRRVLEAIRAAGAHGGDRATVVARFFAAGVRSSVLGRYGTQPSGDSTLSTYAVAGVDSAGMPRVQREVSATPTP